MESWKKNGIVSRVASCKVFGLTNMVSSKGGLKLGSRTDSEEHLVKLFHKITTVELST